MEGQSVEDLLERLKTTLADRHRLEQEIGSGGMATVYLAEDLKHGRSWSARWLDAHTRHLHEEAT